MRGDARMRLIVLDVEQGDVVLIAIVSDDPDRFDALAAPRCLSACALPILSSVPTEPALISRAIFSMMGVAWLSDRPFVLVTTD